MRCGRDILFPAAVLSAALCALSLLFFTGSAQTRLRPDAPAKRIVSLSPSLTKTAVSLGCAGSVAGITSYDSVPGFSPAPVGTLMNPSAEAIIRLAPDAVVYCAEDSAVQHMEPLASAGIRTVEFPRVRSFDDALGILRAMGTLLGRKTEAETLAASYSAAYRTEASRTRLKTLFILSTDPVIAASDSSFIGSLIRDAGGICCAVSGANPYPVLSKEYVVRSAPDVIVSACHGAQGSIAGSFPVSVMQHRIAEIDPDIACRYDPESMLQTKLFIEVALSQRSTGR